VFACTCVCVRVCVCIWLCIGLCVWVCVRERRRECVGVCVRVCVCVCVYPRNALGRQDAQRRETHKTFDKHRNSSRGSGEIADVTIITSFSLMYQGRGFQLRELRTQFQGMVLLKCHCVVAVCCCSVIVWLQCHCVVAMSLCCCSVIVLLQCHCVVAVSLCCCSVVASLQCRCAVLSQVPAVLLKCLS